MFEQFFTVINMQAKDGRIFVTTFRDGAKNTLLISNSWLIAIDSVCFQFSIERRKRFPDQSCTIFTSKPKWNFNECLTDISRMHSPKRAARKRQRDNRKGILMWHVYWNENNLNWKKSALARIEKVKKYKKLFLHEQTTTQQGKFPQKM